VSRVGLGRHARIAENAGDPLDGLVNLFDIGIVLAAAFLIAGLALAVDGKSGRIVPRAGLDRPRTHIADRLPSHRTERARTRTIPPPSPKRQARGRGTPVGTVYRLADGRLVIVSSR
jgi:hypothetical protein